jgi:hypothetical protein
MSTHTNRTAINRANSLHSTGPRTATGKARAALNSLRHGLTASTPTLPSEDLAAFHRHTQDLLHEYQPQGATEILIVRELADTSWRLHRIPALEASALQLSATLPAGSINIDDPDLETCLAVTEALRMQERHLANISVHGHRLSRQFHKTLDHLRDLQATRRLSEQRALKQAAGVFEMHKHKGLPFDPAEYGFVFSKPQIEQHSDRMMRLNQAIHYEYVLFDMPPARAATV